MTISQLNFENVINSRFSGHSKQRRKIVAYVTDDVMCSTTTGEWDYKQNKSLNAHWCFAFKAFNMLC